MIRSNNDLKILSSYLTGKSWKRHLNFVSLVLNLLNEGIKPSVLWDFGPSIDTHCLSSLILELKLKSGLLKSIHVVTVGQDKLICNITSVIHNLSNIDKLYTFVNISNELEKPEVMHINNCIRSMVLNVKRQMETSNFLSEFMVILSKKEWCIPTLFGIFLGYPVVYWFNYLNISNCLSFTPLSVVSIFVSSDKGKDKSPIISFSFPSLLGIEEKVSMWEKSLEKALNKKNCKFSIQKYPVSLPSVLL